MPPIFFFGITRFSQYQFGWVLVCKGSNFILNTRFTEIAFFARKLVRELEAMEQ